MFVGVVIFYNPNLEEVKENIETYISQLDYLLIVDNSEILNDKVYNYFSEKDVISYKFSGENKGIAYALNKGIDFAKKYNADWLLTMDQDSKFETQSFKSYIQFINYQADNYKDAAIFSPIHSVPYLDETDIIKKVESVMTSGNFVNMKIIDDVGYFNEDLFIDSVDHEFCFRVNQKGYGIYRINNIKLTHRLGEITTKTFFYKKLIITNHNYIRRYYITRNLFFVIKTYYSNLSFVRFSIDYLFWTFISITFYEKEKRLKYRSIILGLMDFKRGRFGKKLF